MFPPRHRGVQHPGGGPGAPFATAELALGLLIAAARAIPAADATVRAGGFQRGVPVGRSLGSKTLGIVGLGRLEIGRDTGSTRCRSHQDSAFARTRYVRRIFSENPILVAGLPRLPSSTPPLDLCAGDPQLNQALVRVESD